MADWATSSGSKIRPYRSMVPAQIRYFDESTAGSTAVIERGDVLTSDTVVTSGGLRVVRAPSSGGTGTNLMQVGIKSLIGIAAQNSTSDGGNTGLSSNGIGTVGPRAIGVYLANPGQEFIGVNSTRETGNAVASRSLIGANAGLVYDRTFHIFTVQSTLSTVALAAVQITDIPESFIGDSGAFPVVFKFLSSNLSPVVAGASQ